MITKLQGFVADWASEDEISKEIQETFENEKYVLDPHTAVANYVYHQIQPKEKTVVVSTASPYKFPQTVLAALQEKNEGGVVDLQKLAERTNTVIPAQVATLFDKTIVHTKIIEPAMIMQSIKDEPSI